MKSIANIKTSVILQALRNAKPLTAVGRSAVENYRAWLVHNPMCAIALENSIAELTSKNYDPGLESLVATLKGLMPESKRRIAVAYERLQYQMPGTIFAPTQAAYEALVTLYNANAVQIIDKINDGALDAFKTSPVIGELIQWAKSAAQDAERNNSKPIAMRADVKFALVPMLNIASADEDMLVQFDGKTFLLSKGGKLTYVPDASEITELTGDVRALLVCMDAMHVSPVEANILEFNDSIMSVLRNVLPVKSIGLNLLGGSDFVVMDGESMSPEKAMSLLRANSDDILASMLASKDAIGDALQVVSTALDVFSRYRDMINSNVYVNKFEANDVAVYMLDRDTKVSVVTTVGGNVMSSNVYTSMFDAMTAEVFVTNPTLYDAVSKTFANELKSDAKKMSVRKQIATKLTEERENYETLLSRINSELDELEQTVDVNPDKVSALKALKDKAADKIATIADELSKLSKA